MKVTNSLNLPSAFVEMAQSEYEYKDKQYSVTSLLRGVRETILLRRYHHKIQVDVSDMIWMLFGQAAHHIMEQQKESEYEFKEEYLKIDVGDYKISGRFDLYDAKKKKITDYKTSTIWKVIYEDYADVRQQLLIYAWMLRQIGMECDKGEAVFILKDHSKAQAKRKKSYPQHPVKIVDFKFKKADFEGVQFFIDNKLKEIRQAEKLADDKLPVCPCEQRWRDPDKWAVMKKNRKTALRVLESEQKAEEWMVDNKGDYIEYRPGIDKKCIDYCNVSTYCSYYQQHYGKEATA